MPGLNCSDVVRSVRKNNVTLPICICKLEKREEMELSVCQVMCCMCTCLPKLMSCLMSVCNKLYIPCLSGFAVLSSPVVACCAAVARDVCVGPVGSVGVAPNVSYSGACGAGPLQMPSDLTGGQTVLGLGPDQRLHRGREI